MITTYWFMSSIFLFVFGFLFATLYENGAPSKWSYLITIFFALIMGNWLVVARNMGPIGS
jgi:hypothetical protein